MLSSTSRVGRKPVIIPSGVDVKISDRQLAIKGPKGNFTLPIHKHVTINVDKNELQVSSNGETGYCRSGSESRLLRSIVGTVRSNIHNMITGVSVGFEKKLLLVGVGYKAQAKGKILNLSIGFSHPVDFKVPEGITIETPSVTEIIIKGIDKHLVGHTAAMIRDIRPPEPYKGKGIRYATETIILKETKKK